jgi:hypothetical protein
MKPERYKTINGHLIEEFYWGWEFVVYVDNRRFDGTFDEACKMYELAGLEEPNHD